MRELQEETGYCGAFGRLVASLSPNPATQANRLHLVLAEGVERRAEPSPDEAEDLQCELVPISEALRLALTGGIVNASHVGLLVVGLSAAGRLAPQPAHQQPAPAR